MLEAFLKVFGELRVANVVVVIAAIIFLWKILQAVKKYFRDKWEIEKKKEEQMKDLLNHVKQYPEWHQRSINIRNGLANSIDTLRNKMDEMNDSMSDLKKTSSEGLALTWRYRILRFDDEIRHEIRHTKEHFDQILEDIDNYEKFCKDNPDFPNNKAVLAIKNIKDVYDRCAEESKFL